MKPQWMIPAVLAAVTLGAPIASVAAEATDVMAPPAKPATEAKMAESCTALQEQLMSAIHDKWDSRMAPDARAFFDSGSRFCDIGQFKQGINDLRAGLRDLDITPQS